jgi:hypothetical protein
LVSILQALKVSALFIVTGLIPLLVAIFSIFAIYNGGDLHLGFVTLVLEDSIAFVWFIGVVVGFFIFFIGLFKAIGDITEAALIE